MKKRIFALFLALLMIVPIVACGADDAGKTPAVTTPKAGDTTAAPGDTTPAVTDPDYKPDRPDVK